MPPRSKPSSRLGPCYRPGAAAQGCLQEAPSVSPDDENDGIYSDNNNYANDRDDNSDYANDEDDQAKGLDGC